MQFGRGHNSVERGNGSGGQFSSWKRRAQLNINHNYVDSNLTDWPVLIDETVLPADFFTTVLNGGGDIRVSSNSSGDNRLSLEVVLCDTGASKAELWVKVPSISSTTDTPIYIFYGKAGETQPAAAAAYGKYSVWDTSVFACVYHMQDNGNDSTSYQTNPASTTTTFPAGQIQDAADSDGTQHIRYNIGPTLLDNKANFCYWLNPDSIPGTQMQWASSGGGDGSFYLQIFSNKMRAVFKDGGANRVFTTAWTVSASTWTHVSYNMDSVNNTCDIYKNYNAGTFNGGGSGNLTPIDWDANAWSMMEQFVPPATINLPYAGMLDEVRGHRRELTAAERKWDYNNQYDVSNTISEVFPLIPS